MYPMYDETSSWSRFQRTGRIEDYLEYIGYLKLENRGQGLQNIAYPHPYNRAAEERNPDAD